MGSSRMGSTGVRHSDNDYWADYKDTEVEKFAAFLIQSGIQNKEIVAVFTMNSPEMIITMLALSRIGAVSAMINTNLRGNYILRRRSSFYCL
jgi:acyl-coenzyme A synthetase/AMP-(fatty) acid ligase